MEDRRSQLLGQATDYVLVNGIGDLSLRPLARAMGTSDRMLLYYFGSKDRLVAEVVGATYERLVVAFAAVADEQAMSAPDRFVATCWGVFTDEANRPALNLLFELDALALRHGEPYRGTARQVMDGWVQLVGGGLVSLGVPEARLTTLAPAVACQLFGLVLLELVQHERVAAAPPGADELVAMIDAARVVI